MLKKSTFHIMFPISICLLLLLILAIAIAIVIYNFSTQLMTGIVVCLARNYENQSYLSKRSNHHSCFWTRWESDLRLHFAIWDVRFCCSVSPFRSQTLPFCSGWGRLGWRQDRKSWKILALKTCHESPGPNARQPHCCGPENLKDVSSPHQRHGVNWDFQKLLILNLNLLSCLTWIWKPEPKYLKYIKTRTSGK